MLLFNLLTQFSLVLLREHWPLQSLKYKTLLFRKSSYTLPQDTCKNTVEMIKHQTLQLVCQYGLFTIPSSFPPDLCKDRISSVRIFLSWVFPYSKNRKQILPDGICSIPFEPILCWHISISNDSHFLLLQMFVSLPCMCFQNVDYMIWNTRDNDRRRQCLLCVF